MNDHRFGETRELRKAVPHPGYAQTPNVTPVTIQQPHAVPVAVQQDKPLAVEVWTSTLGTVLKVLSVIATVIRTVAAIVFLYVVWVGYRSLQEMAEAWSTFGGGLGG